MNFILSRETTRGKVNQASSCLSYIAFRIDIMNNCVSRFAKHPVILDCPGNFIPFPFGNVHISIDGRECERCILLSTDAGRVAITTNVITRSSPVFPGKLSSSTNNTHRRQRQHFSLLSSFFPLLFIFLFLSDASFLPN